MASEIVQLAPGATAEDIQTALNSLPDGATLRLAANQTIEVTSTISLNVSSRSITLDLNGSTLKQAFNGTVLAVNGSHGAENAAVLDTNATGQVTATIASAAALKVGDWVKIYSDDQLPNDQGAATRLGQAMQIASIDGNTVTFSGDLLYGDQYQTNVRISSYQSEAAVVENGTVQGDQSHPDWVTPLVEVRSALNPEIDHLIVRDGNSMGINIVDSVDALVSQSAAFNLLDNAALSQLGYAVHSANSLNTTINGFYAEDVRHATDDNAVGLSATSTSPAKYGADIGMESTNVVVNGATATGFSWHSEGRLGSVHDSIVINSWGVLGARGVLNTMYDVAGAYNERGIQFYEYGDGDGSYITVDNVQLSDTALYAFANQRTVHDDLVTNSWFEVAPGDSFGFAGIEAQNTLVVSGSGSHSSVIGTASDDRLLGTVGNDTIAGQAGADYIWGGVGADDLSGGAGADRFAYYDASEGGDAIVDFNAAEGDVLDLSVLALRAGWTGDLVTNGHVSVVQSGLDSAVIVHTSTGDVMLATVLNVDATVLASHISTEIKVTDDVAGSSGSGDATTPTTEASGPQLVGGSGDDMLFGTSSADRLIGNAGDDKFFGLGGGDTFLGGTGSDQVSYRYAGEGVTATLDGSLANAGGAAGDRYSQIERLEGSAFNDILIGNNGVNTLLGGDGDDYLSGGGGADTLYGNAGNDEIHGGDRNDVLVGGAGNDILYGDAGNDHLDGGSGDDILIGGDGDDWFADYSGTDIMTGGAGRDTFNYDTLSPSADTITDFEHGIDRIRIRRSDVGLGTGETVKLLTDDAPHQDGVAALRYDHSTGMLTFEPATSGSASVAIFHLEGDPSISMADIILF